MCGIVGYRLKEVSSSDKRVQLTKAVERLNKRGPDHQGYFVNGKVGFGHARLSIIDTSEAAHQPFSDSSGKYTIIFNGEIYNFRVLKRELEKDGIVFKTQSDTEVLLEVYKKYKTETPSKLNGFFAFAIYDQSADEIFLARDRMGIKPLFIYRDDLQIAFASEIKALVELDIEKEIDWQSVHRYFQLNYIPGQNTIFKRVKHLAPGTWARIVNSEIQTAKYYQIPQKPTFEGGYAEAGQTLKSLLIQSVERRLMADVPVGTFLSGGIDSSVIAGLTARLNPNIESFSIGFPNEPYYDETNYAKAVADKIGVKHHVIPVQSTDMLHVLNDVLDYIDQPFADSSALPVFLLSQQVRKSVTVALSGDGADEMFGGYRKHRAHYKAIQSGIFNTIIKAATPVLGVTPQSRHNKISDKLRQAARYGQGVKYKGTARYWFWASISTLDYTNRLLKGQPWNSIQKPWDGLNIDIPDQHEMFHVFNADMQMLLPGDMLTKVDLMSMANSLEVRVPFLDHQLVDFVMQLPDHFKINETGQKRLLQDTFKDDLPELLYNRPKKGFEIPLLNWFRSDLNHFIFDELLSEQNINKQQIFDYTAIRMLKKQLFSNNPGDAPARIWALVVFQHWWNRHMA